MKIICPGFPKTGTKSMRKALDILGYKNVHDVCEQFVYDYDIISKFIEGTANIKDYKDAFEKVDACTDFPAGMMWREMLEAFSDAVIVLTERDKEMVTRSIKHLVDIENKTSIYVKYARIAAIVFPEFLCPNVQKLVKHREVVFNKGLGFSPYCVNHPESIDFNVTMNKYVEHNKNIKEACKDRKLLVFDVSEGWEPLCSFLEKPIPQIPFPKRNIKHQMIADVIKNQGFEYDGGFNAAMLHEINFALALYAAIAIGFISISIIIMYY